MMLSHELKINASIETVFGYLTKGELLNRWLSVESFVELIPGGIIWWKHANGDKVKGNVIEVSPPHRLVFSYGWEFPDRQIPPGSTTVQIELKQLDEHTTHLLLTHFGLPKKATESHLGGWVYFFGILKQTLEGYDGKEPDCDYIHE